MNPVQSGRRQCRQSLRTPLPLGITSSGEIEVPADAAQAGWWQDGPEPGEPGASVILGHVDSSRGPGVFYGLNKLGRGAVIEVAPG